MGSAGVAESAGVAAAVGIAVAERAAGTSTAAGAASGGEPAEESIVFIDKDVKSIGGRDTSKTSKL